MKKLLILFISVLFISCVTVGAVETLTAISCPYTVSDFVEHWVPGKHLGPGKLTEIEGCPYGIIEVYVVGARNTDKKSPWTHALLMFSAKTDDLVRIAVVNQDVRKYYVYAVIDEKMIELKVFPYDGPDPREERYRGSVCDISNASYVSLVKSENPKEFIPEHPWRAEYDGSTTWNTDLPIDHPGIPTGDYMIHNWKGRGDPEQDQIVNFIFMTGRGIAVNAIYSNGKLSEYGYNFVYMRLNGSVSKSDFDRIKESHPRHPFIPWVDKIEKIADILWRDLKIPFFSVSYYPQWNAITIYLHPDSMKDYDTNYRIAYYLNNHEYWQDR